MLQNIAGKINPTSDFRCVLPVGSLEITAAIHLPMSTPPSTSATTAAGSTFEPATTKSNVGQGRRVRHVALIVEAVLAPPRQMFRGVAPYIPEHEPRALFL